MKADSAAQVLINHLISMKTNRLILYTALVCLIQQARGQSDILKGNILNIKNEIGKKIILIAYQGKDSTALDSALIQSDGAFVFKQKNFLAEGEYALSLKQGKPSYFLAENTPIIVNGSEVDLKNGRLRFQAGKENEIYATLLKGYLRTLRINDSIKKTVERSDQFDPKYLGKSGALKQLARDSAKKFNETIRKLQEENKSSFAASVIGSLFMTALKEENPIHDTIYDNQFAYLHRHYLDHINFKDSRILKSKWLKTKLKEYFTNFVRKSEEHAKPVIKSVVEKADGNETVKKELIGIILKIYLDANNIQIVNWLKNNAFSDCEAPQLSEKDQQLMQRMENLAPGKRAPELEITDTNGKLTKLSSLSTNKAILVLFWASWCQHCLKETPKIYEIYKEFKAKGLEVYAVSLDSKPTEWKETIQKLGLDWINVSDLKHWESPAARRYMVKSTPTIYLLDQSLTIRKIITRSEEIRSELEAMNL